MESYELGALDKLHLEENFISAGIKLFYAFLWQEEVLADATALFTPEVNAWGNEHISDVNAFANSLNNWPIYDQDLQVR